MTKQSWAVTLTPLLVALLQLIEAYTSQSGLTQEKLTVFIGALIAFIGSGAIGAIVSTRKK